MPKKKRGNKPAGLDETEVFAAAELISGMGAVLMTEDPSRNLDRVAVRIWNSLADEACSGQDVFAVLGTLLGFLFHEHKRLTKDGTFGGAIRSVER